MGNFTTLHFIYENTSGNQVNEINEFDHEWEDIEAIIDEHSEDPPDYLVERIIELAKAIR
jgi:hypothetical protein